MSMIEDRLRAAANAAADTIPAQSAPPLHLRPAAGHTARGRSRPRGRRLTVRLAAPLAAAAAVITVIAVAASLTPGGQSPRSSSTAAASRHLDAVPRYYLYIQSSTSPKSESSLAVVRNTRTGATVAIARPPKSYYFSSVAAGADDRTFVLEAAQKYDGARNTKLFRAHLDPAAHTLTVTPLLVRLIPNGLFGPPKLALSANGAELAIAINRSVVAPMRAEILVYSFQNHSVRRWTGPGNLTFYGQGIGWGSNGALFFLYYGAAASTGIRALNTNASSRELLKASRLAVGTNRPGGYQLQDFFAVSGDDTTIATGIWKPRRSRPGISELTEFSAATGAEVRRLPRTGDDVGVLWSNASGSVLIACAEIPGPNPHVDDLTLGVLHGSQLVPILHAPVSWVDIAF